MKHLDKNQFHDKLKELMDDFVFKVYISTKSYPKEEIYGLTSQLRRSSMSIILNYIEGYARKRNAVYKNFLEISYGSLKETKYLIYFCNKIKYLSDTDYKIQSKMCDEIGAMLWGILRNL